MPAYTSHGWEIPGSTENLPNPVRVARCGGISLCPLCQRETRGYQIQKDAEAPKVDLGTLDMVRHDENTLFKVLTALKRVVSHDQAMDCIREMQNEGVLFRERL